MDLARPLVDHAFLSFCLSVSRYICIDWDSMASGVRGRFDEAQKAQRRFFIFFFLYERSTCMAWWRCSTILSDFVLYIDRVSVPDFLMQILFYLYTCIVGTRGPMYYVWVGHFRFVYFMFIRDSSWSLVGI